MWRRPGVVIACGLALAACASPPRGPSVMVLPGTGKSLEQFQADDTACRPWAAQQVGGADSEWMMQRRYDIAYQQCMYSRGHQIPGLVRPGTPPPPPPGSPPPPAGPR